MVVTAEARHGTDVPVIKREDVTVNQGRERMQVTDWIPLEGEHAALQLFVLVDDASGATLGAQLEDLRRLSSRNRQALRSVSATCETGRWTSCRTSPTTML